MCVRVGVCAREGCEQEAVTEWNVSVKCLMSLFMQVCSISSALFY